MLFPLKMISKLNMAPNDALMKNTFEGEKRSATVNIANINVPDINPNCTAEVIWPSALLSNLKSYIRSDITPFPANHKEMQPNCVITITGNIHLG
jgi:hypothetical protein